MATIKARFPCPDCGSEQDVKDDGRKYYINCTECRTMSTFQSKQAKARLEKKLNEQEEKPVSLPPLPVNASDSKLNQIVDDIDKKSFFSSILNTYNTMFEEEDKAHD